MKQKKGTLKGLSIFKQEFELALLGNNWNKLTWPPAEKL
jgi:hypothetical protein